MGRSIPDRIRVLAAIEKRPKNTPTLAVELGLKPQHLANLVVLLLEDGIIERCALREDGWTWLLTDLGRGMLGRAMGYGAAEGDEDPDLELNARRLGV